MMIRPEKLPVGFRMELAGDLAAETFFASLSDGQQESVVGYITRSQTGDEAKNRTETAVSRLHEGRVDFT